MAHQPIKKVEVYETPDGEKHETFEEAMRHYQKTVCEKAVCTWVVKEVFPRLPKCEGQKYTDDIQETIVAVLCDVIQTEWRSLHEAFALLLKAEGSTGLVSEGMYAVLERTLPSLDLPERVLIPLQDSGRHIVGQVVASRAKDLLQLPKFGAASLRKLEAELGKFGLKVGMDVGGWTCPPEYEEQD